MGAAGRDGRTSGEVEAGADRWPTSSYRRQERGGRTLTASEAAAVLGVSVATVRGWADQGRLPSHRTLGGHRRFDLGQLRAWLEERGAAAPVDEDERRRQVPQDIPACPQLARELNVRTEAIVERMARGYAPEVPLPRPAPSPSALQRSAIRFVRVVAGALDSGRTATSAGRAELAGLRGGLQGAGRVDVLAEHARLAHAVLCEAEDAVAAGAVSEPLALAALHAVIDTVQIAVAEGHAQARQKAGPDQPR